MTNDERVQGFVARVDRTIAIAQQRIKHRLEGGEDMAPPGVLEHIVRGLSEYREKALNGKLPPSEGEVNIGILRAVADWGEPFDSELLKAAKDLEGYYIDQMK